MIAVLFEANAVPEHPSGLQCGRGVAGNIRTEKMDNANNGLSRSQFYGCREKSVKTVLPACRLRVSLLENERMTGCITSGLPASPADLQRWPGKGNKKGDITVAF